MKSRATRKASAQRNLALDVFIGDVSSPKGTPRDIPHNATDGTAERPNAKHSCQEILPSEILDHAATPRAFCSNHPTNPSQLKTWISQSGFRLGGEPVVKVENRELEVEKWKQRKEPPARMDLAGC